MIRVGAALACGWLLVGCTESYSLGRNPASDGGADGGSAPGVCYVGGCSGQLCSDVEGLGSTCEWRNEFACYQDAQCERQTDGRCDWTETSTLRMCLDSGGPVTPPACYVGGCSREICSVDPEAVSTCEVRPEQSCYRLTTCARQPDGACAWTPTTTFTDCLASFE